MRKIFIISITFFCYASVSAQDIFRTVCRGDIARLDSLLRHSSIDVTDNRGRSLLHWAVACEKIKVLEFLVDRGITLNQEDHQKRTPLYVAVQFNRDTCFNRLLDLQSENAWIDQYGISLVERAILSKNERFVRKLIESGVDVNKTNERGSTPLEISKRIGVNEISEVLLSLGADETRLRIMRMQGEYMGQEPPGLTAQLFAPNFISTEESEFGSVFNSAGTEFYYGVDVNGKSEIRYTTLVDGEWAEPAVFLSHGQYGYNDPFLSNDENRLYFISKRALDGLGAPKDVDIWYVQKSEEGWSEPINAGSNINSDANEFYISFTSEGTMYFSSNVNASEANKNANYDIFYAEFVNGVFQTPTALSNSINTEDYEADVFISPDESYIIFCSTRENGFGQGDLYLSFKDSQGNWTEAINMGEEINTPYYEYCPFVTKDGKYLFYTSNQDIYWISTEIIDKLKKNR